MRWSWGVLLVACTTVVDPFDQDEAPRAAVLSPAINAQLDEGTALFEGRVDDERDPSERLFVIWSVGPQGADADATWREQCRGFAEADGRTLCRARVQLDDALVRLDVVDVAGFRAQEHVRISVVEADIPVVQLLSPMPEQAWFEHLPVQLAAVGTDADGDELAWTWRSSEVGLLDGPTIPDSLGVVRGAVLLPAGVHRVTAIAQDALGREGDDSITIQVREEDADPMCRIETPLSGDVLAVGARVLAEGVVLDDVTAMATAEWRYKGALLAETPVDETGWSAVDLDAGDVVGVHSLTLAAEDDQGHSCEATVEIEVDTPPTLRVDQPADVVVGPVDFAVEASDGVTPPTELVVSASSSVDGPLWTASPDETGFVRRRMALSVGAHTLSLTVTDGGGLSTSVSHPVQVQP